jgi:hypothetical protein
LALLVDRHRECQKGAAVAELEIFVGAAASSEPGPSLSLPDDPETDVNTALEFSVPHDNAINVGDTGASDTLLTVYLSVSGGKLTISPLSS